MDAIGVAPSPSRLKAVVPDRPIAAGRRRGPNCRMARAGIRGARRTSIVPGFRFLSVARAVVTFICLARELEAEHSSPRSQSLSQSF